MKCAHFIAACCQCLYSLNVVVVAAGAQMGAHCSCASVSMLQRDIREKDCLVAHLQVSLPFKLPRPSTLVNTGTPYFVLTSTHCAEQHRGELTTIQYLPWLCAYPGIAGNRRKTVTWWPGLGQLRLRLTW